MSKKLSAGIFYNNLYWIGSFILSTIIISSLLISGYKTFFDRGEKTLVKIPVIIEAKKQANYADGVEGLAFPGIELGIVEDVIDDSQIESNNLEEIEERIVNLVEEFTQPIPTATEFPTTDNEGFDASPTPVETENLFAATNTVIPVTGTSTRTATAGVVPSLTLTPSNTPTIQLSPTNTLSPTWTIFLPTSSQTVTFSPTMTSTRTFTPTFTLTSTRTLLPTTTSSMTMTITPSRTPTLTFTPTNIYTPSITPSWTIIPTFTFTPTSTRTPTLTFTPTYTSTFTRTPTLTFTPTFTGTFTPTLTRTPTLTSTLTYTNTFTPTFTRTPTSTITPTLSPTITPSPTLVFCNIDGKTLPLVKSMQPPDGSENVPLNIKLQIVFNQAMDANTLVYGDETHVVICEKINDTSNSCRSGTEVSARIELRTAVYLNDTVLITPIENLENGTLYTLFAGNQIAVHPDCRSYGKPVGGREKSDFNTIFE